MLRRYRSVEEMPDASLRRPGDPVNLRLACELASVLAVFGRVRFPPGVHRYHSVEEASAERERWLRDHVRRIAEERRRK